MKINKIGILTLLAGLALVSCKNKDPEIEVGSPAAADFTVTSLNNDPNTYVIENTTAGAFVTNWSFDGGTSRQAKDTIFLARKGTYTVTMTTASKSGAGKKVKTIDVPTTSPLAADFTTKDLGGNKYEVEVITPNAQEIVWMYSNGMTATGQIKDTVYFPFSGDNTVTLTIKTANGLSSFSNTIKVASTDMSNPDLTDPVFLALTGGYDDKDGRTWLVDLTGNTTSGVGPYKDNAMDFSYWNYPSGYDNAWKNGCGANEYTFIMDKYRYVPKNQMVTVHYDWAVLDFKKPYSQYTDLALEDPRHKATAFILKNEGIGITGYTLKFGDESYLGYCDGRRNYEIAQISATKDTVWIRHKYADYNNGANADALDPSKDGNQRVMRFILKK